ncbi:MAG: hypothetical protein ACK559_19895, partial [bacterium]
MTRTRKRSTVRDRRRITERTKSPGRAASSAGASWASAESCRRRSMSLREHAGRSSVARRSTHDPR